MLFYNIRLLGSLLESFLVLRTARERFLRGVAKRLENSFVCVGMGWWRRGDTERVPALGCPLNTNVGGTVNQVNTLLRLTAESAATTGQW